MRKMGLEPTRHECHKILSLARLPVPTLPHFCIYRPLFFFQTTDRKIDITIILHKCQSFFLFFASRYIHSIYRKLAAGLFAPPPVFQHLIYIIFRRRHTMRHFPAGITFIPYFPEISEFRQTRLSGPHRSECNLSSLRC